LFSFLQPKIADGYILSNIFYIKIAQHLFFINIFIGLKHVPNIMGVL